MAWDHSERQHGSYGNCTDGFGYTFPYRYE